MSSSPLNPQSGAVAGPKLGRAAGFGYLAIFVTGIAWYAPMMGLRAGGDAVLLGHIRPADSCSSSRSWPAPPPSSPIW